MLFTTTGTTPNPFSNILIIVSKLPVIPFTNDEDTDPVPIYWFIFDNLTKLAVFLINDGVEPVPSFTINITLSNALLEPVTIFSDIDDVDVNWIVSVLLILFFVFLISVGKEPVPFSIILVTISNPLSTLLISIGNDAIDDVICEPLVTNTPLLELFVIVGIEPVPFEIILITLAKDEDTNNLSDAITLWLDVNCVSDVFLIPFSVFDTIVGAIALPLAIILATLSYPSSIAFPPIAVNFAKSFAKLIPATVSTNCISVALLANLK